MQNAMPSPTGILTYTKSTPRHVVAARRGDLIPDERHGHYWAHRAHLRYSERSWDQKPWQQKWLAFVRDHIHPCIPNAYYNALLGHDIHLSMSAELYVSHFHAQERDPFSNDLGWTENLGRVSCGKVTTAFRDFLALMLVTDSATIGDFKFMEVGTDNTAEANSQTALIATTGIARVVGTQTNPSASTYQSIGTVTADTTETWTEHGQFNASTSGTMLDRSLISPTASVVASDTVTFTYLLSLNAEA